MINLCHQLESAAYHQSSITMKQFEHCQVEPDHATSGLVATFNLPHEITISLYVAYYTPQ